MNAPTLLLVGFLGAGKTTFLRTLLPRLLKKGLAPYVVINDYRNARIDAASLKDEIAEVLPISGSCVCCDSLNDLIDALLAIPEKPNRVVLIETNGTTDPCSLIEHLTAHAGLRTRFSPLLQLTVVDVKRWQRRLWHDDLERLQALTASHLVLTRADTEPEQRVHAVRGDLAQRNPKARETDANRLAEELANLATIDAAPAFQALPPASPAFSLRPAFAKPRHSHHELAHGFISMQIELPRTIRKESLMAWLEALPAEVLRVKGLVELSEIPGMFFVVQRTDDAPYRPTMFPLVQEPTVTPCAVLIGVRLDAESIRRQAAEHFREEIEALP